MEPNASHSKKRSTDLMPAPFAWIDIPGKSYSIAKYPITHAQYAQFIDGFGYSVEEWWSPIGWKAHRERWAYDAEWGPVLQESTWTEPLAWYDRKFNGAEQPVIGVSWYEAEAFCLWLSAMTGEIILLPSGFQWQYAAQGDDGRTYPWGDAWDCTRCNNSVRPCRRDRTSLVDQYEGKGDSPFGVVDMTGNVWEWCQESIRGGSYHDTQAAFFRCDYWGGRNPSTRDLNTGFRIARI